MENRRFEARLSLIWAAGIVPNVTAFWGRKGGHINKVDGGHAEKLIGKVYHSLP